MRLLHCSDWHIGATLGRIRRRADHERVLDEIVAIASDTKPHLILNTGDLFDYGRPSAEDLALAVDALRRLATEAPVVVLAGNHDSPAMFDVFDRLLALGAGESARRVRFLSRAKPPSQGGILTFPGAEGEEIRLASVPFVHPNALLEVFGVPPELWTANYADQVRLIEEALGAGLVDGYDAERHILLFAAHLHVGGATFSGSERPLHVSDSYATLTEYLPAVTYAAFGHIHKPQPLPGPVTGTYAGSPIPIDYGERDEQKSVVLLEAIPGRPGKVTRVPLSGGRRLIRLSGTLEQLATSVEDAGDNILDITCDVESHVPDLGDRLRLLFPRAAFFDVRERAQHGDVDVVEDKGDAQIEPPVEELFRAFLGNSGVSGQELDRAMAVYQTLTEAAGAHDEPVFQEEELFSLPPEGDASAIQRDSV